MLLAVFGIVWIAAYWLTATAAPGDNVEQLIWIRSLELGYYKHPPLPTWIMAAAAFVFGPSIGLTYILGAVLTLGSLAIFWSLLCRMRGKAYAMVAILAALSITFYSGRLYYYNHNVVMMIWISLAVALTWQVTVKPSLLTWALLGAVSGLAGRYGRRAAGRERFCRGRFRLAWSSGAALAASAAAGARSDGWQADLLDAACAGARRGLGRGAGRSRSAPIPGACSGRCGRETGLGGRGAGGRLFGGADGGGLARRRWRGRAGRGGAVGRRSWLGGGGDGEAALNHLSPFQRGDAWLN